MTPDYFLTYLSVFRPLNKDRHHRNFFIKLCVEYDLIEIILKLSGGSKPLGELPAIAETPRSKRKLAGQFIVISWYYNNQWCSVVYRVLDQWRLF